MSNNPAANAATAHHSSLVHHSHAHTHRSTTPTRRAQLGARIDRFRNWEYWPTWAIYLPLTPYIIWLAIRHGGPAACTACNPAIPLGGLVGESKADILDLLPQSNVLDYRRLKPATPKSRAKDIINHVESAGWTWPIILKPDAGYKGRGVALIQSPEQALQYLHNHHETIMMQRYHPGPHEAGIFYVREPGSERGRIISLTHKVFPTVVGNGSSTIRQLIWNHPRHRVQASIHINQLEEDPNRVPANNETVNLGFAGNHARGTMFLDGQHLITPELEQAFDDITNQTTGFNFGRFDVRYQSPEHFAQGKDFAIIELNGLTSEATSIYDPNNTFLRAQRALRNQWRWAFTIGKANINRGARPARLKQALQAIRNNKP